MRAAAAVVVLGLAAPAAVHAADPAPAPVTVHLGVLPALSAAPLYIADELGYFKAEGITIETTTFTSAAEMVAPLAAGQLDAGGGAAAAGFYNAVARGSDVRIVSGLASDPLHYGFQRFLVRTDLVKSGKYKTVADLKGMTVANNAPGVTAESQLEKLLESGGLKFSDVKHVYLSFPDSVVALKNGAIDAVVVPEPNATVASLSGAAVNVIGDDAYYPNQEAAILLFGSNLLRAHRDVGVRFMRAFLRGVRFYNGALANGRLAGPNADAVIKILQDKTPVKDEAVYRALTPPGSNVDGKVNMASIKTDYEFFTSIGLIPKPVDVNTVVDPEFAALAVKSLGPYKPGR